MPTIKLAQPAAGEHVVVPSEPFAHIVLDFPADTTLMEHPEGSDSLIFHFADGAAIEMEGFYAQYGEGQMPEFEVEGQELKGEDFFASFGPELAPAAPPRHDASSGHGLHDVPLDEGLDGSVASLEVQQQDGAQNSAQAAGADGPEADADAQTQDAPGIFGMEEAYSVLLDPGLHDVSFGEHDDLLLGSGHDDHDEQHDDQAGSASLTAEAFQNGLPEESSSQNAVETAMAELQWLAEKNAVTVESTGSEADTEALLVAQAQVAHQGG